jgi:hypothetical protein
VITARFWYHNELRGTTNAILAVRQSSDDPQRFDAVLVGAAQPFEPICVERQTLTRHSVPASARSYARGTEICFGQPR